MSHPHKFLNLRAAITLTETLTTVGDLYPARLLTERDFQPRLAAHVHGHFPNLAIEVGKSNEKIDFRIGGTNPVLIELAVQPRELQDANHPGLRFPGFTGRSVLYPASNKSELKKLRNDTKARARYLLLIDLKGIYDPVKLFIRYQAFAIQHLKGSPNIQVIYARGTATPGLFHFLV